MFHLLFSDHREVSNVALPLRFDPEARTSKGSRSTVSTTQPPRLGVPAKMAEPLQETTITPDASTENQAASPPPDSPGAVWTRRIIIFAFWAVVATLGLPHWIWTTSIYRSELPVDQMTRWAEGNVGSWSFQLDATHANPG